VKEKTMTTMLKKHNKNDFFFVVIISELYKRHQTKSHHQGRGIQKKPLNLKEGNVFFSSFLSFFVNANT
jgi:hypothetical protein